MPGTGSSRISRCWTRDRVRDRLKNEDRPNPPMKPQRHGDRERTGQYCLTNTDLRGYAADSRGDVDLSNFEPLSMSSPRLLPILWMGTGAIESVFLSWR